ncbi:MAG: hypothetical protein HOP18_22225 [Deltaproteobacteria bacterium]|nr:hypothetical protein [Deltaproteobacteria bacterium]
MNSTQTRVHSPARPNASARRNASARQKESARPPVTTRSPATEASSPGTPPRGTPPRGTPPRDTPAPVAASRTRLIRFRLNPRSDGDQQILGWLARVAPYYRADAIRTALLTHILRRHTGNELASVTPPVTEAVPATAPTTAQKLEKMFSA